MNVYDRLEAAGHNLTMLTGPHAGVSNYVCEDCGALIQTSNAEVILFHVHRGSQSTEQRCALVGLVGLKSRPTLKEKLDALLAKDMERLRAI